MTSALTVRQLRKTYANGFEALKGVDLDVQEGDFFALLGPNGAGKSTLIGTLASLVRKSAGSLCILGHDLDREPEQVKALLGLVPQEFNCNQFEPVEEIVINQAGYFGVPRRIAQGRAHDVLAQLELWEHRRKIPRQLSGGMKRRLMIARALMHRPRLLILDEPTAGVDIEIRRTMWAMLREINAAGTTVILTTHYLEEAEMLCRNIAIINHGEIIAHSSMDAMLRQLHSERFVLNLREPLDQVPDPEGFVLERVDSTTLEVSITHDQGINRLFAALSDQGIEVLSLRNKENRLERLFIDMLATTARKDAAP